MATAYIEYQPVQNHVVTHAGAQFEQMQTDVTFQGNLQTTLQALTDTARGLPAEKALCDEIEELCRATLAIDQAFYDIRQRLSEATKEQQKRAELYETCCDLETRWKQHHETYQRLIRRSRQVSGEAQCAVDDFCLLFLPFLRDPSTALPQRQQLIREQIKVLEDRANTSQDLTQEFIALTRTLDTYIADFSRVVEGLDCAKQTETTCILKDRLYLAEVAMDAANKEVKKLGWKFTGRVVVTGIAVLLAIVVPTWWAGFACAAAAGVGVYATYNCGTQLLEARRPRELAVGQYKAIKNEYELEQAYLNQMVKLESTLRDSRQVVDDVTMKLGAFTNVWAAISADIGTLQNSLTYVEGPTSLLFVQRVQRLERLYGCLSQALRHYQVTVRLPESRAGCDEKRGIIVI